jgi:hypothetical protein
MTTFSRLMRLIIKGAGTGEVVMRKGILLSLALLLSLGWLIVMSAPTSAATCPTGWGSLPKVNSVSSQAHITAVRAGPNQCFDRLVFDVNGPVPGYSVRYVSNVFAEGTGAVLPVTGGAKLEVVVRSLSDTNRMPSVNGFKTFRSVVYGGSFEGQTTVGLGVRARLPFRVFTLTNPSRVVLDVAHKW